MAVTDADVDSLRTFGPFVACLYMLNEDGEYCGGDGEPWTGPVWESDGFRLDDIGAVFWDAVEFVGRWDAGEGEAWKSERTWDVPGGVERAVGAYLGACDATGIANLRALNGQDSLNWSWEIAGEVEEYVTRELDFGYLGDDDRRARRLLDAVELAVTNLRWTS